MTLEHKDTHVAEALARFTEQFKNKPNLTKLVSAFVERNQGVEDIVWEIYNARMLDNATDSRLDDIGAVVGQAREGRIDDVYRQWIAARIFINRSNGRPDDSLHVLELIIPDYPASIHEYYPAAYAVRLYGYPGDFNTIFDLVRQVKPAGVRLHFEYSAVPLEETFRFAPADVLITADYGFADSTSPGTGGRLAGVRTA